MPRISNNTTTTIMDPSKKQAMVHIAATTIKYMCPHLKTFEVMKIVNFDGQGFETRILLSESHQIAQGK